MTPASARPGRLEWGALAAIVAVASVLRIPALDRVPAGFFCDEASTGYDAFCLLHTARDQYGEFLPLFCRSFGDYNEALYRYLAVPFVALLGLTERAVRMPAALIGVLTVFALWLLARRWYGSAAALGAAALLAFSGWHVHFSRVGFRGILLPFFLVLGVWLLHLALERPRWFPAAGLVFGVACYTYSPVRALLPLLLLGWGVLFRERLVRGWRPALTGAVLMALVAAPSVAFTLTPEGRARAGYESVFRDRSAGQASIVAAGHYVEYFAPGFLLLTGDPNLRHHSGRGGQLRWFEAVLALGGLVLALVRRRREDLAVVWWLLLVPLVAAFTRGPPNALRTLAVVPAICLLGGVGIERLAAAFGGSRRGRAVAVALSAALLLAASVETGRHLRYYWIRYPVAAGGWWTFGWRDALASADRLAPAGAPIHVTDRFLLAHSYVLFYKRIPPRQYQADPVPDIAQGRWRIYHRVGRYVFGDAAAAFLEGRPGAYVLRSGELPHVRASRVVFLPDGRPRFRILRIAEDGP